MLIHFVDLDSEEATDDAPFSREANAILEHTADELIGGILAALPRQARRSRWFPIMASSASTGLSTSRRLRRMPCTDRRRRNCARRQNRCRIA